MGLPLIYVTFFGLLWPFFPASGEACVNQPCLRSTKSQRKKQSSSKHWSEKTFSLTKVLMITALPLPSIRHPTMVLIELVWWLMQEKSEENAVFCIHKYNQNVCNPVCRYMQLCAHTKLLLEAIMHTVSLNPYPYPYKWSRTWTVFTELADWTFII